jgi:hypothetical protein
VPADLNYAHEKYVAAVRILALGDGDLRSRLLDAYLGSAHRAHPPVGGLGPPMSGELVDRINEFHERMTSEVVLADEGTITATVHAMTPDDVHAAAAELVDIAKALDWEWHDQRRQR